MSNIVKVVMTPIMVTAIYATTTRVIGHEAAGTALLVTFILIGGYLGTAWGGRQQRRHMTQPASIKARERPRRAQQGQGGTYLPQGILRP